jgi:CheY-like chemotaxis protein
VSESATLSGRRTAATRIAAVRPRERVTLTGTIRSVATDPIGSSPAFRCVIADGSGEIEMLFLGHQQVSGLTPRRRCTVQGMACVYRGRLVIWNPRYALQPAGLTEVTAGQASCRGESTAGCVLVVGDDPGMCRVIEVNLATRGYQVGVVATSAAVRSPDLGDAGLIVVDIGLAEAAGLATIGALRQASAAPILTISGLNGEAVAQACAGAGSDDFLAKPFPIRVLLGKVAGNMEAVGQR